VRLPHELVLAPRVARLWGHDGWTLGVWTFVAKLPAGARFVRHEYRHVQQWLAGTALGVAVILWLHVSLWWLLASPLGFLLPYFVGMIGGYQRNPFERDAERYADRAP
jgi:hypothetical protein